MRLVVHMVAMQEQVHALAPVLYKPLPHSACSELASKEWGRQVEEACLPDS